ncbi:hypothetical protein Btru_033677 [Bulinus truncatus]|nr:hypothetical protein Btru_033677 [Bulinus truncatus]
MSGYWGMNCSRQCQSPCSDYCCMEDGSCNSICIGYSDPPKCSKACSSSTYGANCSYECSNDCFDKNCDSKSGASLKCHPGKYGDQCAACQNNSWGNNCTSLCSIIQCLRGVFNSQTGTCTFGYVDGYQLPECTQNVSNKDKHEYETVKKSSGKEDTHYADIGNTVDIG